MAESTIITVIVIGAERTSLLLVPYYRYYVIDIISTVFKMVFIRYYLYSECIEKYYVIVTEIIATVLKWFSITII